jgi:hypothetical protein
MWFMFLNGSKRIILVRYRDFCIYVDITMSQCRCKARSPILQNCFTATERTTVATYLIIQRKKVFRSSGKPFCFKPLFCSSEIALLILTAGCTIPVSMSKTPQSQTSPSSTIRLSNNQISDVRPLTSLSKVYNLQLDQNQISDLRPLAKMKTLSTLNLKSNRISDVKPLAELPYMRELILDNNQITDLRSLSALQRLEQLHVRQNPLSIKECPVERYYDDPVLAALGGVCRFD